MSIYVEILIRAPMEALWAHSQTPELHERWDLRFSRIDYLPRASETEPQRFRYATRIGLGLEVVGEGESLGERDLASGSRSSALKFTSADSRSLIREGAGYWKYVPTAEGIIFLTWYDYRTRFGALGGLIDRVAFQPLMGWATAWSFDRLRLWLEDGVDPSQAMRQTLVHGVARVGLALIFAYHGLVPKASRTSASGTTRSSSAFALSSTSITGPGGHCSAIVGASTSSGRRSRVGRCPATSCRSARSVANEPTRRWILQHHRHENTKARNCSCDNQHSRPESRRPGSEEPP